MPEFLTRRHGTWHFVRRVPLEFAEFDGRGVIKHSTRIRIDHDRAGRRAARVAEKFNERLELTWRDLALGQGRAGATRYEDARQRARLLGYEYLENAVLLERPSEARLERLEALVAKGMANDPSARAALLGTEKRPSFKLSRLFTEFEVATMTPSRLLDVPRHIGFRTQLTLCGRTHSDISAPAQAIIGQAIAGVRHAEAHDRLGKDRQARAGVEHHQHGHRIQAAYC